MNNSTNEHKLAPQGGRTLASATAGNASSTTVLLYLHRTFTVGDPSSVSRTLVSKESDIHRAYPTLPGWGNTSPPLPSTSYVGCITSDMTALLDHLYPDRGRDITLYLAGGVLWHRSSTDAVRCLPYDGFPYGRHIVGVLLMTALTSFRYHEDYAKHMTWSNYVTIGPVSQWPLVGDVLVQLLAFVMARKVSTPDAAKAFSNTFAFDEMSEAERDAYARWRAKEGIAEGEIETRLATNVVRSVATSLEGFKRTSSVLHADWGSGWMTWTRRMLVRASYPEDKVAPPAWTAYLAAHYKNASVKDCWW